MIVKNEQSIEEVYQRESSQLGKGSYGEVCAAIHKSTGQRRAIKQIARSKIRNWERFQSEVRILQTLDHPNVIKLYEYFEDEDNVYLVTELCAGGELFDRIIKAEFFEEDQAAVIFRQILQALNYCHTQNVVHRDLKPENFLFQTQADDADLKIIDFGLSKIMEGGRLHRMKTRAGTPYYISPEVLAGNYDISCDMWSAGCMLYILLCGYPPFYGDNNQEILEMVRVGQFEFDGEEWDTVSNEAKDLIKKLIVRPERRLTASEALQHPWMRHHNAQNRAQQTAALRKLKLGNMKKFAKGQKMKQVALMAIAVQSDPNDIAELKTIFQALDSDNNGNITFEELQRGIGNRQNGSELIEILKGADTDGNGSINYTEFLAAAMDQTMFLRDAYIKTAFQMLDKDKNGTIDSSELLQLLAGEEFRDVYSQTQIDQAIREIDANGDGQIDFEEFVAMMRNIT